MSVNVEKQKENKSWEDLVKNKVASLLKDEIIKKSSFREKPRRMIDLPDDMFLPEYKSEKKQKNEKFNLMFFLDVSYSCLSYKDKFFNLVKTIPEDKFNVHLYSFDTSVYKLDKNNPYVRGGGGTAFYPIEQMVQLEKNKEFKGKHPDLIFVLTDGDGTTVVPEKSENWYWLLTDDAETRYIPSGSNIINLSEFEAKNKKKISPY